MSAITQPYPGIRPFNQADWPIFFGRAAQTSELLHKLETNRFVAVVGSSGSGKSSLVKAGLIHSLDEGYLMGARKWTVIGCRPGTDPFFRLASNMPPDLGEERKRSPESRAFSQTVAAGLRASRRGILPSLERLNPSPDDYFVLLVDQFEELFAFRSNSGSAAMRDEAERFVEFLMRSCDADVPGPFTKDKLSLEERVWVILTMRSDFIGNCEVFPEFAKKVSESQFLVPVLSGVQKQEAIIGPSHVGEVPGAVYSSFQFVRDLVSIIVNETGDQPDQLPLMQHALMRSWAQARDRKSKPAGSFEITLNDYQEVGRIKLALGQHAEAAWAELNRGAAPGKEMPRARFARQMFMLMCDTTPDGQVIRRRPKVKEVLLTTGAELPDIKFITEKFRGDDRNMVVVSSETQEDGEFTEDSTLDVSHEAILRQWPSCRRWLEEERLRLDELRQLCLATQANTQGEGELLRGKDLTRVLDWQKDVNQQWASRYIEKSDWEATVDYINMSADEAKRLKERELAQKIRATRSVIAIAVLAVLGLAWNFWKSEELQKEQAKNQIVQAQIAAKDNTLAAAGKLLSIETNELTRKTTENQKILNKIVSQQASLFALRAVVPENKSPSNDQWNVLWEVATLGTNEETVRAAMLTNWFSSPNQASQALRFDALELRSVVGLATWRRDDAVRLAVHLFDSTPSSANLEMWETVPNIISWFSLLQASNVAPSFYTAMTFEPFLKQMNESFVKNVNSTALNGIANCIVNDIERTPSNNLGSLAYFVEQFTAVADRLKTNQPPAIIERLTNLLDASGETSANRTCLAGALGASVVGLAPNMDSHRAAYYDDLLIKAMASNREMFSPEQGWFTNAFDALAIVPGAKPLETAQQLAIEIHSNDLPFREDFLCHALATVAGRMEPSQTEIVVSNPARIVSFDLWRDRNQNFGDSYSHASALRALTPFIGKSQAGEIGAELATAPLTNYQFVGDLVACVTALAPRMETTEVAKIVTPFADRAGAVILQWLETTAEFVGSGSDSERLTSLIPYMSAPILTGFIQRLTNDLVSSTFNVGFVGPLSAAGRLNARSSSSILSALANNGVNGYLSFWSIWSSNMTELAIRMDPTLVDETAEELPRSASLSNTADISAFPRYCCVLGTLAKAMNRTRASALAQDGLTNLLKLARQSRNGDEDEGPIMLDLPIVALVPYINSDQIAEAAIQIGALLTEPRETNQQRYDMLASALTRLTANLDLTRVAKLKTNLTQQLEKETDFVRTLELCEILKGFLGSSRVPGLDGAIAAALDRSETKTIFDPSYANRFARIVNSLPNTSPTVLRLRLVAIDQLFQSWFVGDSVISDAYPVVGSDATELASNLCSSLDKATLTDVLKWPSCGSDARRIVLRELEKQTGKTFTNDVWNFVAQAASLGITNIDTPPKKP